MAKYSLDITRTTASTTLALGIFQATATNPRRLKVYELNFGSDDTASDDNFKYVVDRVTGDGSLAGGTARTPRALDDADPASFFDAQDTAISTNPTIGNRAYPGKTLNQRASHRWVAAPGSELVCAATNNVGFAVLTPSASAAKKIHCGAFIEEL